MNVNILFIGSAIDPNLIRLIQNIKKYDADNKIILDVLHINPRPNFDNRLNEVRSCVRNLFFVKKVGDNRLIAYFTRLVNIYTGMSNLRNADYDLINIHYSSAYYSFFYPILMRKGRKIMITPWGSDIYRISKLQSLIMKKLYDKADYISCVNGKFKQDVFDKFSIPEAKYVELGFGSTMIDKIILNENISRNEAKDKLGLSKKYVIVCGYNASIGQQHIEIINALSSIKNNLPENVMLVFPMTYAKNAAYIEEVKQTLIESTMPFVVYEDYLNEDVLLYLRKCADVFVHIQISDAFSASVQEYILCDTIVITGEWVRYPSLESWGIPYVLLKSIEDLSKVLCEVILNGELFQILPSLKLEIQSKGYKTQAQKWIDFFLSLKKTHKNI